MKYFLLILTLFMHWASAQFPVAAFWQLTNPYLRFTTLPQSLASYNCSGVMTVQASDSNGNAINVMPDLTVNLAGDSGLTYYSDSACTAPITDVTILSGTSSKNFYFTSSTVGLVDVVASASGYDNAQQTETITANQFIWIGAAGDANWSSGANWLGGVAPGTTNTAIFNDYCVSNCSPNITSNISVKGVKMFSPYAGTITQMAANTITVANDGWYQESGNFFGGTASVTINRYFIVNGGSYTATSGIQSNRYIYQLTLADDTFTHNNGKIVFTGNTGLTLIAMIKTGNNTLNHLDLAYNSSNHSKFTVDGTLKVGGNFATIIDGTATRSFTSGTIEVSGDVDFGGNTTKGLFGNGVLKLVGNPAGQTITGVVNSRISNLDINTGIHPVTLNGTVAINGNYIVTSAGSLTTTGSTINFSAQSGLPSSITIDPGNFYYNHVSFTNTWSSPLNINLAADLKVKGDLVFNNVSASHNFKSSKIIVEGNVTMDNVSATSSTTGLEFSGTNDQTVTTNTTSSRAFSGNWIVNKPSGKVSLINDVALMNASQDLTIQSGTLDQNGHALTVSDSSGTDNVLTIDSGATLTQSGGALTYETLVNNGTLNP